MRKSMKGVSSGIKALAEDLRFRGELPPSPRELRKELRKRGELPLTAKQLAAEPPPPSNVRTKKADDPVPPVEKADDSTIGELLDDASELLDEKPDAPVAITMLEYGALEDAFDFLNAKLFDGMLQNVQLVYGRRAHSGGHFAPDRFTYRVGNGGCEHELSLNPDAFVGRTNEWIVSILLHEMCHLWQHQFGKKKRKNYSYHDKEWAMQMKALGLMPSNTGAVGGKETGQKMSHYIIPGGAYQQTFAALAASGWVLRLQSTIIAGGEKKPKKDKTKYTCPSCGLNLWGNIPDAKVSCDECGCVMSPERPVEASQTN
jgi:predicted SprT family Zn-dependent metalloprotease